jgi:hypothetical protein
MANGSFSTGSIAVLKISLATKASFYTMLAMSATSIDPARDKQKPILATKYIATALNTTNSKFAKLTGPPTNDMLAEVVLYIGYEVSLFPLPFNRTKIKRTCMERLGE